MFVSSNELSKDIEKLDTDTGGEVIKTNGKSFLYQKRRDVLTHSDSRPESGELGGPTPSHRCQAH